MSHPPRLVSIGVIGGLAIAAIVLHVKDDHPHPNRIQTARFATTIIKSQHPDPVATPAYKQPNLDTANALLQQGEYRACISEALGVVRDRHVPWSSPEWQKYQARVAEAHQIINACWAGQAHQLAATGDYTEAILALGRTYDWLGVNDSTAAAQPLVRQWATELNLTGEWWLCGYQGSSYLATNVVDPDFVHSNACNGDDARCFCQKIHD